MNVFLLIAAVSLICIVALRLGYKNASSQDALGTLTILSVTERPLDTDKNGDAYCSITGSISGPGVDNAIIYRRMVMPAGSLWFEKNQRYPVAYRPNKVQNSWYFCVLDH